MIPLFYSQYSGKSLLTFDPIDKAIKNNKQSILKIAKDNNILRPIVVDTKMTGVLELFQNADKEGLSPIFGLNYKFLHDLSNEDNWHRIILFIKNNSGYKDLIRLHNIANIEYNGYITPENLKKYFTENLELVIPFYDSFIFRNTLYDVGCQPEFGNIEFTCCIENNGLPFDSLVRHFAKSFKTIDTKTIFYETEKDFLKWLTYRCCLNFSNKGKQRSLSNPMFDHCHSNQFSFESFKSYVKNKNP